MRLFMIAMLGVWSVACSGDTSSTARDLDASLADTSASMMADGGPLPDAAFQVSLDVIPGEITYAASRGGDTHIYSISSDGSGRIRLTRDSAPWSYHSVSPNRRYIAAVRSNGPTTRHAEQVDTAGVVWIIDVRTGTSYPVTPDDCNAGIGGVAWTGDSFITFAMTCDEQPPKAYLASYADETRDVNNMLLYGDHMFPVRDISAALYTSRVLYVVDQERCIDGQCVQKPQVWLADTETMQRCQVTDADREFLGLGSSSKNRVGDHNPVFTDQLRGVVFSRNVDNKGRGSTGHHDVFRIGLNMASLDNNDIRCEQPGTEVNLSNQLLGDDTEQVLGASVPGFINELFPQPKTGDAADDSATLLFVGRTNDEEISQLVVIDLSGAKTAVSLSAEWVVYGGWIISDLELTGSR